MNIFQTKMIFDDIYYKNQEYNIIFIFLEIFPVNNFP